MALGIQLMTWGFLAELVGNPSLRAMRFYGIMRLRQNAAVSWT